MSDPQPTEPTDVPATETQEPAAQAAPNAEPTAEVDHAAEAEKWKALSRKHEAQAKANAEAARRLAEIEEANKTEEQKRADREAALTEQNQALAAELARTRAAVKFGLNDDDLAALEGVPADKVEAVAARIAARTPVTPPAPSSDGQGKVGTPIEGTKQLTRADLARMTPEQIEAAREGGRLNDLLGIH